YQAGDGIRGRNVTGVQTCALPIFLTDDLLPSKHEGTRNETGRLTSRLGAAGVCRSVGGQVNDEGVDEGLAGGDLLEFDELVGGVGLGNVPGSADDGRDACLGEQTRLGAVGDLVIGGDAAPVRGE